MGGLGEAQGFLELGHWGEGARIEREGDQGALQRRGGLWGGTGEGKVKAAAAGLGR